MSLVMLVIIFCVLFFVLCTPCHAYTVNMEKVAQIESSGDYRALNLSSGARGLYQMREIAWRDVQGHYPELKKYSYLDHVFDPEITEIFAVKYFGILEKYLRHYGKEVNTENLLRCYHAGIGNFIKGNLGKENDNYIKKYRGEK